MDPHQGRLALEDGGDGGKLLAVLHDDGTVRLAELYLRKRNPGEQSPGAVGIVGVLAAGVGVVADIEGLAVEIVAVRVTVTVVVNAVLARLGVVLGPADGLGPSVAATRDRDRKQRDTQEVVASAYFHVSNLLLPRMRMTYQFQHIPCADCTATHRVSIR